MARLWDWFGNVALPWFSRLAWSFLDGLSRLFGGYLLLWFKVMGAVVVLFEGIRWSIYTVGEAIANIGIALPSMVGPNSTLLHYGTFINRFLPLTESFALFVLLAGLWVSVIIVRWVKSFIPTISN